MAKGPKKYFNDGAEHIDRTHKMPEEIIHLGARHTKKCWPVVSFKNLSDRAYKKALSNKYYNLENFIFRSQFRHHQLHSACSIKYSVAPPVRTLFVAGEVFKLFYKILLCRFCWGGWPHSINAHKHNYSHCVFCT